MRTVQEVLNVLIAQPLCQTENAMAFGAPRRPLATTTVAFVKKKGLAEFHSRHFYSATIAAKAFRAL